jgi:hypothetical protein
MPPRSRFQTGGRFAVIALVLCHFTLGCTSGDRPVVIRGKVTFQSQPVAEGTVQFNDAKTGRGAEVELGPDGSYMATLPAGNYAVVILPPILPGESAYGPPDPRFKKVHNIPERYRSTATSRLTATVSAEKTTHDFEMKP